MPRDYRRQSSAVTGGRNGGSLLAGILIGLVLGLAVALGVAWYINKMPSPFGSRSATPSQPEPAKPGARTEEKSRRTEEAKPRFDFYKILPGPEEPTAEKAAKDTSKRSTAGGKEAFFLQAGSFQNAPDADNLKARLALLGVEATIETTSLPDKGIWHRVRIGPYTNVEELNRARDALKQNGVQTTLIKARETER